MKNEITLRYNDKKNNFEAKITNLDLIAIGQTRNEALKKLEDKFAEYKNYLSSNDIDQEVIDEEKEIFSWLTSKTIKKFFLDFFRQFFIYFLSLILAAVIILKALSGNINYYKDRVLDFFRIDEKVFIYRFSRKLHHMAKEDNTINFETEKKIIEDLKKIRKKYKKYFDAILED